MSTNIPPGNDRPSGASSQSRGSSSSTSPTGGPGMLNASVSGPKRALFSKKPYSGPSPSKKKFIDCPGYIVYVSELYLCGGGKASMNSPAKNLSPGQKQYYHFEFEMEPGKVTAGISFRPGFRHRMEEARESGRGVVLMGVEIGVKKFDNETEQIVFMNSSKMDNFEVGFPCTPPVTVSLNDIKLGVFGIGEYVAIKALAVAHISEERQVTLGAQPMRCRDFVFADTEGGIRVTFWEGMIDKVDVGFTYLLTTLAIRMTYVPATETEVFHLTCSPKTIVKCVEDLEEPATVDISEFRLPEDPQVFVGEIIMASVEVDRECLKCGSSLPKEVTAKIIRCPICKTSQKWMRCKPMIEASIELEFNNPLGVAENKKFQLSPEAVLGLLPESSLLKDNEEIQNDLLELDCVRLTVNSNGSTVIKAEMYIDPAVCAEFSEELNA